MRPLLFAFVLAALTLGLAWLLGPRTSAPPLPPDLIGADASWLQRAEQLSRYRRWLAIFSLAATPLVLWLFVRLGWSAELRGWLERIGITNPWLLVGVFTALLVVGGTVLELPLGYASLLLRRSYELSEESTGAWLVRQAKSLGVSLVLLLLLAEGLYWLLRVSPQRWWLLAALGAVGFSLLLTYLTPYVITPIFFTQRPLEDAALRDRIVALGARVGVPIGEVYVIDASTQGNEGNAYFTGIGGATRVVLYDTVLREFPEDELLVILAHELGHWREQHVWKGLLLSAVLAPLGLWIVHRGLGIVLPAWGIRGPSDVAGLPLIMLLITLGTLATLPAQNWLSRRWEREADRFSIAATNDPDAFGATFARLARQNLSDPTPPPLYEGLFGTHPAVGRRVAAARSAARP